MGPTKIFVKFNSAVAKADWGLRTRPATIRKLARKNERPLGIRDVLVVVVNFSSLPEKLH